MDQQDFYRNNPGYVPPGQPGYRPLPVPTPPNYLAWPRCTAGQRAAAFLVDWLLQVTVLGALSALPGVGQILGLAALGFHWWWQGEHGQTVGKMALGIYLVDEQAGQPIGGWKCIGRDLLHILDYVTLTAGWWVGLATGQTIADRIMHTIVVRKPSPSMDR